MGKKLYVGNLPFSANDDFLQNIFQQAGAVESARVIIDKMSGRSKGFGFVEMATDEEAQKAVTQLNQTELEGRKITVAEAKPQTEGGGGRPRHGGGGRGGFGGGGGGRGGFGGGGGGRGGFGGGGGRGGFGGGGGGRGGPRGGGRGDYGGGGDMY